LKSKYLLEILHPRINCPSYASFKILLKEILTKLHDVIETKLKNAISICLIVAIWTNKMNRDFIAIGAVILNNCFEKDFIVVDMMKMPSGGHNTENIKKSVELMMNKFTNLDKSKIIGNIFLF